MKINKVYIIACIFLFLYACEFPIQVNQCSHVTLLIYNSTSDTITYDGRVNYSAEYNAAGTRLPYIQKIAPRDTFYIDGVLEANKLTSTYDRLHRFFKDFPKVIHIVKITSNGLQSIEYKPSVYNGKEDDMNYYNVNYWKEIELKHFDNSAMFVFK